MRLMSSDIKISSSSRTEQFYYIYTHGGQNSQDQNSVSGSMTPLRIFILCVPSSEYSFWLPAQEILGNSVQSDAHTRQRHVCRGSYEDMNDRSSVQCESRVCGHHTPSPAPPHSSCS